MKIRAFLIFPLLTALLFTACLPAHALAVKKDDLQIFPWFEGLTWDMSDAERYVYIKERKGTVDISVWT